MPSRWKQLPRHAPHASSSNLVEIEAHSEPQVSTLPGAQSCSGPSPSTGADPSDQDIDALLARGEEETRRANERLHYRP